MTQHTSNDIRVSHWEEHVRNNPQMYFPTHVNALEISKAIEESAKILGATETSFKEIDGWSYFCADVDWIFKSAFQFESIGQIFSGPGPFPEVNEAGSFRYESLCLAFCSDVFTHSEQETEVLKGSAPSEDLWASHRNQLGNWGRIVGFKFSSGD